MTSIFYAYGKNQLIITIASVKEAAAALVALLKRSICFLRVDAKPASTVRISRSGERVVTAMTASAI